MAGLSARDVDYVETRLLAPAPELSDAIERLRRMGMNDLADQALAALGDLTEATRAIHRALVERSWGAS